MQFYTHYLTQEERKRKETLQTLMSATMKQLKIMIKPKPTLYYINGDDWSAYRSLDHSSRLGYKTKPTYEAGIYS